MFANLYMSFFITHRYSCFTGVEYSIMNILGLLHHFVCISSLSYSIKSVSMPFTGFSLFYCQRLLCMLLVSLVSMPLTGFSHFYDINKIEQDYPLRCVNALHGLLSFLQCAPHPRIISGFPGLTLQVIIRIF